MYLFYKVTGTHCSNTGVGEIMGKDAISLCTAVILHSNEKYYIVFQNGIVPKVQNVPNGTLNVMSPVNV